MMVAVVAFEISKSLKTQVASLYSNSGVCILTNHQQVIENIGGGSGVCSGVPLVKKVVALVALSFRRATRATTDRHPPTQS